MPIVAVRRILIGRSLEECIDSGRDNMMLVRLFAAVLVLLGHSYVLAGPGIIEGDPLHRLLGNTYSHLVGVMIFFMISGLLITMAWKRRPRLGYFLRSRALRILPALITCVVGTSLILGALLTSLPAHDYFQAPTTWAYIFGNASLIDLQWQLPGVFNNNPVINHVNGSLWTLPVEASLYLIVAGIGCMGLLTRRSGLANASLLVAVALAFFAAPSAPEWIPLLALKLCAFFAAGSLACINRRWIPMSTSILLVLIAATWLARGSVVYASILAMLIAYATLWLAYVPRLPILRFGDLSYGTYLWGFPLQQALIHLLGLRQPWLIFVLALPATLFLAALSWHLVERPSLRWKIPRTDQAARINAVR